MVRFVPFRKRFVDTPQICQTYSSLAKVGKVPTNAGTSLRVEQSSPTSMCLSKEMLQLTEPLVMPLEGIHIDDKLQFVAQEPILNHENTDDQTIEAKPDTIVKVRWNL
ncbi:hypothetical protein Tco_1326202 [Tanacetum coccineum]